MEIKEPPLPLFCDCCGREVNGMDYRLVEKAIKLDNNAEYRFQVAICIVCCARILRCVHYIP